MKNILGVFLFALFGLFSFASVPTIVSAAPFTDEEVKQTFNDFDANLNELPLIKKIITIYVKWMTVIAFGVCVIMSLYLGYQCIRDPEKTPSAIKNAVVIWVVWIIMMLIYLITNFIVSTSSTVVN